VNLAVWPEGYKAWIGESLIDCLPDGLELVRHIDCGSFIYHPVHAA